MDFKGIQRSVSFEKGDKVQELRYHIMVAFSDVGLDKLPPARVKLLKYDESVQDYVRLHLDSKLQENIRVKVELKEDKVKCTLSELHANVDGCKIYFREKYIFPNYNRYGTRYCDHPVKALIRQPRCYGRSVFWPRQRCSDSVPFLETS